MTQVLADIAGMFELFAIASGLLLLHRELTHPSYLRRPATAGACTTYFWFKDQWLRAIDSSHMGHPGMMRGLTVGPGIGSMPSGTPWQASSGRESVTDFSRSASDRPDEYAIKPKKAEFQ